MTDAAPDKYTDHSSRYTSIVTGDDCVLIYDQDNPDAWLKSDGSAPVRE